MQRAHGLDGNSTTICIVDWEWLIFSRKTQMDLMESVGAPLTWTPMMRKNGFPLWVEYWNLLNKGWFKVYIFGDLGEKPIYIYGPDNFDTSIILFYNKEHFDGVRRASDLFGQPYCLSCESVYNRKSNHSISCKSRCSNCSRVGHGVSL
uniref:Uncharacterized protein n=1 Tax=Meloidogyne enterolobii TaxID=390850 RepID=A0A6V7XWG9_MELEN|nr:unnamed protein product [Meloidogyne enterolobii]